MKQLEVLLFSLICTSVFSQAPQNIPYQAVVRNTDGSVLSNTPLTMTFKIHDVSATGTVVYEENHTTSSNAQGLVALNVAGGTPITGTFNTINWGNGAKFLHVLMNADNGVVDLGTQQMMSVPYALYADDVNVRVSNSGDSLFIGDQFSIVPGVSAANPISMSNYGSVLLPGNATCQSEYISVTGCGGQDSLLYFDRYYNLVEIGGQCWFAENLATDKYRNGNSIPIGEANMQWQNISTGFYTTYNNEIANDLIFGKLYNWYTTVDPRGVCPTGWHVPSDCEWMYLENSLGMSIFDQSYLGINDRGSGFVGKSLRSKNYWIYLPGDDPLMYSTNSSGFNALPGGYADFPTSNGGILTSAHFWTTTYYLAENGPVIRMLGEIEDGVYRNETASAFNSLYNSFFSIRCIKD